MDIGKQIKELELEQERLLQKQNELKEKQKLREALDRKLEKFFDESNFGTPKDLAEALIEKYNIRLTARRPGGQRRKRTTITADLRDEVKTCVATGESMNAVSKRMEISYAVIVKIIKGAYDHLQSRPNKAA